MNRLFLFSDLTPCRKDEKFGCGAPCVETCSYKPLICPASCIYGCHCKEGYVRLTNKTGSLCVKRENCKLVIPKCGKNEVYSTCASPCPDKCEDLTYPLPKPGKVCPAICKIGCTCKKGFYLNSKNKCVRPSKCCGRREKFRLCGPACSESCTWAPNGCTKQCVMGCFCSSSKYVRLLNGTASNCIHRKLCPNKRS